MIGDIFNLILLQPALNLLAFFVRSLEAWNIPGALGVSIVLLTLLIKLVLWPFTQAQVQSMKKMADLKPDLDQLKRKHSGDKQALAKAQMELYKANGVNPAGGCLPTIIQALLIFPLYQVVEAFLGMAGGLDRVNYFLYNKQWIFHSLPNPHFLGLNLADKPADFAKAGLLVLLVPLIAALTQFVLSKMMLPKQDVKTYPSDSKKEVKEKEGMEESMMQMQSQMAYLMPVTYAFIAFSFPIGLAIYLITLNIFTIWQQYLFAGWGGMGGILKSKRATTKVKIER